MNNSTTKEQNKVSVIEDYLDCIDSLPVDLSRMLTDIREQDCIAKDNAKKLENLSDDLHKTFLNNSESDRVNICNDLLSVLEENLLLGEKKVKLAQKTFEMVSARIKRIDEDAAIIEEEEFSSTKAQRTYTNDLNAIIPSSEYKTIKLSSINTSDNDENMENTNSINTATPNTATVTHNKTDKKSTTDSSTLSKRKRQREKDKDKDKDREKDKEKDKDKDKNDKDISDTKSPTPLKKESKHKNSLTSTKNSTKTRKHSDLKHLKNNEKSVTIASDLDIDPDEPTYCKCHQVSYGEMIACDNSECAIEWFHCACVGLNSPPKGKWYCEDCTALMAKKNKKK